MNLSKFKNIIRCGILLFTSMHLSAAPKNDYVIMGSLYGRLLYVTTYTNEHKIIPQKLYIYPNGKELIATLRIDTPLIEPYKHASDNYSKQIGTGRFVYEIQSSKQDKKKNNESEVSDFEEFKNLDNVIVFSSKKKLKIKNKKLYEATTGKSYEFNNKLYSNEGVHTILTIKKNSRCLKNIDYYYYFTYSVEPSSKKEWRSAYCGKNIDESDAHF
jgi:hypothetical protein